MSDSILDKLERGWQAVSKEKPEEILQIVSEIEKNENLTAVEKLKCQVLKGIGLCYSGKFNRALKIGKHAEIEGDIYSELNEGTTNILIESYIENLGGEETYLGLSSQRPPFRIL